MRSCKFSLDIINDALNTEHLDQMSILHNVTVNIWSLSYIFKHPVTELLLYTPITLCIFLQCPFKSLTIIYFMFVNSWFNRKL